MRYSNDRSLVSWGIGADGKDQHGSARFGTGSFREMRGAYRYITLIPTAIISASFIGASLVANWLFSWAVISNSPAGSMLGVFGVALVSLKIIIPFIVIDLWRNHYLGAVILATILWIVIFVWCWLGSCVGVYRLLASSTIPAHALISFMDMETLDIQIRMSCIVAFYIELLSGFLPLVIVSNLSRSFQDANSAKHLHSNVTSALDSNIVQLPVRRDIAGSVMEFLNRRTELNEHASVGASDLYLAFKDYCHERDIAPCSQKLFGESMTALKFERARLGRTGRYHYRCIHLRQSAFDVAA